MNYSVTQENETVFPKVYLACIQVVPLCMSVGIPKVRMED